MNGQILQHKALYDSEVIYIVGSLLPYKNHADP